MAPEPLEQHGVSMLSQHDLQGRTGFKLDLQEVDGRWYLYYAGFWHSGWGVLDVTDPADPEYLRWIEGPENTLTMQIQVADGLMVTSLEKPRRGRGALDAPEPDPEAPFAEGAFLFDVATDPESPERVGHYQTGGAGTHRNFYAGGDYAYMAAKPGGAYEERLLEIVDVSDPTDPEPVSKWWWPGQHEDEAAPLEHPYYFHGPAYVREDVAYLSYGGAGAVLLDVSDVTEPELLTWLDLRDFGSWLGVHSAIPVPDTDLMVVNDEAILEGTPLEHEDGDPINYTVIVDVSDLSEPGFDGKVRTGPRIVSWVPHPTPGPDQPFESYHDKPGRFGAHNQAHYREDGTRYRTSDHLVMTWFNAGLRVFDISNPLAPTEAAHFVPGEPEQRVGRPRPGTDLVGTFEDVVVDPRGVIYVTDPQQGLYVLEADVL